MRLSGNWKPDSRSALTTRWRASRTAGSGRPTMWKAGSPLVIETSIETGTASRPFNAALLMVASTAAPRGRMPGVREV